VAIKYFNQDTPYTPSHKRALTAWIKQVVTIEKKRSGDINFIFCSDKYLLSINREYLKHDYYTDVITFDYSTENFLSGDIFISVDTVLENSKLFQSLFDEELNRVVIHGVLHLCGYNDKSDVENRHMRFLEDKYLVLFENK